MPATEPTIEPFIHAFIMLVLMVAYFLASYKEPREPYDPKKNYRPKKKKCKACNDRGYRIFNGVRIPCPKCNPAGMKAWVDDDHDDEVDHFIVAEILDEDEEP